MMSTSESLPSVARERAHEGLAGCFPPSLSSSLWPCFPSALPTGLLLPHPHPGSQSCCAVEWDTCPKASPSSLHLPKGVPPKIEVAALRLRRGEVAAPLTWGEALESRDPRGRRSQSAHSWAHLSGLGMAGRA